MKAEFKTYAGAVLEIVLWSSLALGLYNLLGGEGNIERILYDADGLFPAMLYRDLVEANGNAASWVVPPSLQLFPDLLLYFAQATLVEDIGARQHTYAMLQYFLLIGSSMALISAAFAGDSRGRTARRFVLAAALIPVLPIPGMELNQNYYIAFLGAFHMSPWITTLLCGTLLIHPRFRFRPGGYVLLFILFFLGIVSDPLFVAILPPAALIFILNNRELSRFQKLIGLIVILVSILAGLRTLKFVQNALPMLVMDYAIAEQLKIAVRTLDGNFPLTVISRAMSHFVHKVPGIAWLLALPTLLLIPATHFIGPLKTGTTARIKEAVMFLGAALLGNVLIVFCTAGLIDFFSGRYLPGLFFAVFPTAGLCAFLLPVSKSPPFAENSRINTEKLAGYAAAAMSTVIVMGLLVLTAHRSVPGPPLVRCLDENAHRLSVGYADYWNSSPVLLYSRKGIHVHQVNAGLKPMFRVNSFKWYAKSKQPDFVVTDRLNIDLIRERFGTPDEVLKCGSSRVYLYGDKQRQLLRAFHARMLSDIRVWRIMTGR